MDKKPRTVITSEKAKDHVIQARSLMDKMNEEIYLHRQNLERNRIKSDSEKKEIEKVETQNNHDLTMQQQKLNAVNLLI